MKYYDISLNDNSPNSYEKGCFVCKKLPLIFSYIREESKNHDICVCVCVRVRVRVRVRVCVCVTFLKLQQPVGYTKQKLRRILRRLSLN
jgi:hypothetical protein